jgi:hypothetical protein
MEIIKSGSQANIEAYDAYEKERNTLTFECPRCKCVFKMCTLDCDDVLQIWLDEDESRYVCKCPECGYDRSVDVTSVELYLVPVSPDKEETETPKTCCGYCAHFSLISKCSENTVTAFEENPFGQCTLHGRRNVTIKAYKDVPCSEYHGILVGRGEGDI